ncbi:hypothetical protein HID58_054813, partial [Brassica napus]
FSLTWNQIKNNRETQTSQNLERLCLRKTLRKIFKFCDSGIFFEQRLLILNPLILPSSQTKASAGFGLGQAEHALSDAKRFDEAANAFYERVKETVDARRKFHGKYKIK